MKLKTSLFTAIGMAFALAGSANAALLLSDNFTVTGTSNTFDINYHISVRQTGDTATQTWTGGGNVQVGNNSVFGGSGDYLMVADGGSAQLTNLTLSSTLVPANEKLVISFEANAVGDWVSFMISPSSTSGSHYPTVGSGDFGMLFRPNGQIQAFNNGTIGSINDVQSDTTSGPNTITLTFSGSNGTGSAFAGNGTMVSIYDGTNTWSTVLDTGFTSETISFGTEGAGDRGYVDNLQIYTIPEPSAALIGGLGMLALLRRRR